MSAVDKAEPALLLGRLDENVKKTPEKVVFSFLTPGVDGGRIAKTLTFDQLATETTALAVRLLDSGLKRGDRALLVYPPSLDFTVAFLACLKAGVVAVPVFPPNPGRRDTLHMFTTITESSGAQYALTNGEYNHAKKLASAKDAITRLKRPLGGMWPENLKWIVTTNKIATSTTSTTVDSLPSSFSTKDLAFLQYTSGSTSEPKGVMITHGNLAHNLTIITRELEAKDDTVVVSWLPQYHDMGLIGSYLGVLYCGGSGFYLSPLSFLHRPMIWIEAVSKHFATHLQAPNFAFKLTSRKFQPADYVNKPLQLGSVRHIINAAEPVDAEAINSFYKSFGPFGLKQVIYPTYGLAEHTVFVCSGGRQQLRVWKEKLEVDGIVAVVTPDTPNVRDDDSSFSSLVGCGYPMRQGVDVRIVDRESEKQLDEGKVGEIWISSPSKAAGYFGKGKETKDDFEATIQIPLPTTTTSSPSSYLRTGDLGFLFKDELFICGRLKDLIIVAGRNYYPQDIEATAEAVSDQLRPGCSAAFTIDTTHEGGEEVALVVELRKVPDKAELQQVCDSLADLVRASINQEHSLGISQIVFLETKTVPKTSSGKIARAWCRKSFLAGTLKAVYSKSFKQGFASFEVEKDGNGAPGANNGLAPSRVPLSQDKINEIRAMGRNEIMDKLRLDVARTAQIPPDSIDNDTALVTILDSLSISQFKGRLESAYAVKISDEYLFGETVTLKKLSEVVKFGYAPDDTGGGEHGGPSSSPSPGVSPIAHQGKASGLAGALGCPPGVRCVIQ